MNVLIPATGFTLLFVLQQSALGDWRQACLRAAALWAAFAVLATEVLSLLGGVTAMGLSLAWSALLAVAGFQLWRMHRSGRRLQFRRWQQPPGWATAATLGALLVILGITATVAWTAPPQTWDSLNYHMSRVAHWTQDRAVHHYPTGIDTQNSMPPGAEMLVLQLYVLGGGDRLVNFVQWFAMLGCLVGVAAVAREMGIGPAGQRMSVIYVATLPVGIVQSSSTMTDYVVALWIVCVAVETLRVRSAGDGGLTSAWYLGMGVGLAALAKPTGYAFALPLLVLAAFSTLRRRGALRAARWMLAVGAIALLLNAGHFLRNQFAYGNPIAPRGRIAEHRTQFLGGRGLISNLIRNLGLHAGTPSPHVNKGLALAVQWAHQSMGLDLDDPRTTSTGRFRISLPTTNEDRTANPLHAYLALALLLGALLRKRGLRPSILLQLGIVAAGLILFSLLFKWQTFGGRYHLPLFVLAAPAIGGLLEAWPRPLGWFLAGGLLLACYPWLVHIKSRPLIPIAGQSYAGSVLSEPRQLLYFANGRNLMEPYTSMTEDILQRDCDRVGLILAGNAAEYPLWVLLGAPRADLELGWIVSRSEASLRTDPSFAPCAVICEGCSDSDRLRGVEFSHSAGGYSLYFADD